MQEPECVLKTLACRVFFLSALLRSGFPEKGADLLRGLSERIKRMHRIEGHHFASPFAPNVPEKTVESYRRSCRNGKTSHRKRGGGKGVFRCQTRANSLNIFWGKILPPREISKLCEPEGKLKVAFLSFPQNGQVSHEMKGLRNIHGLRQNLRLSPRGKIYLKPFLNLASKDVRVPLGKRGAKATPNGNYNFPKDPSVLKILRR